VQAIALYEAVECGGMFGPIRVGGGKTLLSFLVASVLEAKRPLLLLPAALIEKTRQERETLARHWRLPTNLQIKSYEILGRVSCAEELKYIRPDLLIADEVHRLKNHRAGVTRRVTRYLKENPDTKFVGMSGTIMKSSLRYFGHILRWCLKDSAPIPLTEDELGVWADALDENSNPLARVKPGAIFDLGARPDGGDALSAARQIFQKRLLETPGVVASGNRDDVGCSLYIKALEYECAPVTDEHFKTLRTLWETPDGWAFSQALELRRHALTLSIGMHHIWDPRPPVEWLTARREWAAFVRETLAHSRTLDTELQVANACDAGLLSSTALRNWRDIRDTFTINPKPMWHDDSALKVCETWLKGPPGIVWTEHVFFAKALAKRAGVQYYGADGLAEDGRTNILDTTGKMSIVVSIQANSTGRNLQAFSRNLVTSPPPGASGWEQLLGRTHRPGQKADEVTVDVLVGCREHHDAFEKALEASKAAADTMGHDQKLLLSDVNFPPITNKKGARWA